MNRSQYYDLLLDEIKKYSKICIFRHIHPDGDAVGSQLALKHWIHENFPSKEVYALGDDLFDIYPYVDDYKPELIIDSLAIVVDTATTERVDGQYFRQAQKIIRIDHHPVVERFEDILIAEIDRSSVCELLTSIFRYFEEKNFVISKKCCEFLCSGILTDTLNFRTANTSSMTLENASYLMKKGVNLPKLSERMFAISQDLFKIRTKIRELSTIDQGVCIAILDKKTLNDFKISASIAKNCVAEFGGVKEFCIWAILAYNSETGLYDGSLRCKKEYSVNEIASHFHGGGHRQASGIRHLSLVDIEQLKKELIEQVKNAN